MTQLQMRIGQGWDVHALVPGRRLIIGGVHIPYHLGLLGHSDADVLLHAIIDAMLGAAGLGDIGTHFPDTDVRWKNADSLVLLAACAALLKEKGWRIQNLDTTVIAQALIAAAPDLLAVLEAVAVWTDAEPCFCHVHGDSERARYSPHNFLCDCARTAILKAKGDAK